MRRGRAIKWIIMACVAVSLMGVGVSYAYWSEELTMNANITTGTFAYEPDTDKTSTIQLVNMQDMSVVNEAQRVIPVFEEGRWLLRLNGGNISMGQLLEPDMALAINLPLKSTPDSKNVGIREMAADLSAEPATYVTATAQNVQLLVDETPVAVDVSAVPVAFGVYYQIDRIDNEVDAPYYAGTIYLVPEQDSIEQFAKMPSQINLTLAQLPQPMQDTLKNPKENVAEIVGVIACSYELEVDLLYEQLNTPAEEGLQNILSKQNGGWQE